MESKLADHSRKTLVEAAKRQTREERLRTFVRHSKLVTELAEAGKRVRAKTRVAG
ncbi:MAG: hypothetical protein M3N91_04205 [Pseudomonadota bacterium]|nr:hypothetical protein [Pseudomonadota bacterium]